MAQLEQARTRGRKQKGAVRMDQTKRPRPNADIESEKKLFADNFHQGAFATAAVDLAVENLFPGAEIEFAFGDGDHDFAAHDLALEMGVGVIFAGAIVAVSAGRRVRREFFEPDLVIVMESTLVVVNEDGRRNVHGVDQAQAFAHAALAHELRNLRRDVEEAAPAGDFKPEMFGERFHEVRAIGAPALQ